MKARYALSRRAFLAATGLTLATSLVGCGSTEAEAPEAEAEETSQSIVGTWNCVAYGDLDSLETAEEYQEGFGRDLAEDYRLMVWDDGTAALVGDDPWAEEPSDQVYYEFTWEQSGDAYSMAIFSNEPDAADVPVSLTFEDDGLKLVLGDQSFSFVWVFEYAGEPGQKIFSLTLDDFSLDYSMEQTLAMSSMQNGGRYLILDDVVYGLFIHPGDGTPAFASAPIEVSDTGFNIGEPTVILDDVFASWIAEEDGYLYFSMNVDRTDGHQVGIARVPVGGTEVEVLYEYVAPYLIVRNGKLYYTDDMSYLRSMNVDGTGDEPVLGKPVYYPYLLDDTWLVYQDDQDGETLHLYGLGSNCDERITEYRSYCPIAYGPYLYFTEYQAEDEVGHLCRVDTETWEKEDGQSPVTGGFFIAEGCIYLGGGSITAGPDVLTGDEPTTSALPTVAYKDADFEVLYVDNDDGVIRSTRIRDTRDHFDVLSDKLWLVD